MKISFNSKVILTFSAIAVIVKLVDNFIPGFTAKFFSVGSTMSFSNLLDYFRLVSHVLGHASWGHLFGNLMFLLLLGPILEEKYGHADLFLMILITALITGIINVIFLSTGLLGASGIVFMLIILVSFVGKKDNSIPIEFLFVAFIFLGNEVINVVQKDNISQIAHILGGIFGAFFGFGLAKLKEK